MDDADSVKPLTGIKATGSSTNRQPRAEPMGFDSWCLLLCESGPRVWLHQPVGPVLNWWSYAGSNGQAPCADRVGGSLGGLNEKDRASHETRS